MSGFSVDWLSLREPVDARARNAEVLAALAAHFAKYERVHIADLASGTGSSLRALRDHLPAAQLWRLTDHDEALLGAARLEIARTGPAIPVEVIRCDLAAGIEGALGTETDLATTSAFLDLVSADWIDAMVAAIARRRLPFYAALTYDGRISCDPAHPLDGLVTSAVNLHQLGDKGFGPALGPQAAARAVARFEEAGYSVVSGASDWVTLARETVFQRALVSGWAEAARETGALSGPDLDVWLPARTDWIDAGYSQLTVGHVDFLALPAAAA